MRHNNKENHMSKAFPLFGRLLIVLPFFLIMGIPNVASQENLNQVMIQGTVIDAATLQPIAAAQVSIPDKNVSAVSDEQGRFSIQMTSPNDILHVTAIGYSLREVALQGRRQITAVLYREGFATFYKNVNEQTGIRNRTAITSSLSLFDEPDKYATRIADDIIHRALSGNVRSVTRSGVAGVGSNLFIRGVNSLHANTQPLFIVDGVIWDNFHEIQSIHEGSFSNPLDNIDVNDIENISVIRDGTSIYGSKAANGVVLITTKRAKSMVTSIDVNVMGGLNETPGTLPMMQGEQFRIYASDMLNTLGIENLDLSNIGFLVTDPANPNFNVFQNNTNWSQQVYQPASTQAYQINVRGGDEKALYYFSLGFTTNQGAVKSTSWDRFNVRLNADFKPTPKMTLAMNLGFARNERRLVDDGINLFSSPTWMAKVKTPIVSPYAFTNTGEITANWATTDLFNIGNPQPVILNSNNFQKKYRFNLTATPTYQITPHIKVGSQFDYSLYKTVEGHFVPMRFTPIRFMENRGLSQNRISSQVLRNTNIFNNTFVSYDRKWGLFHHVRAVAGVRFIANFLEMDYVEEHNSGSNNNTTITGFYDFLFADGLNNRTRSLSNYYQAEYAYDNRYFLTGTLAFDASSRFGRHTNEGLNFRNIIRDSETGSIIDDRSRSVGVFPAINGAWIASSEEFMRNLEALNFLKIRAGYGVTGNDGIRDYESMSYFMATKFIDRATGLVLTNLENSRIQWETTRRANIGFDMGFFNDIFTLNLDLYSSNTRNLLTLKPLPEITGLANYWSNGGTLTNRGFELNTHLKVLNTKQMQWELGFAVGSYKNEVTALPNGNQVVNVFGADLLTAVGQPVGVFYGYKTLGVFATQADAQSANLMMYTSDGQPAAFGAGDAIFEDFYPDGIIDEKDRQIIGSSHPDLYGNFNSALRFGALSFEALFTYSLGNQVYNFNRRMLESGTDFSNQTLAMQRRWTGEGQVTDVPRAVFGDPMGNARFSNRWIEDGSFLRFKSMTVSYDLPINTTYIQGLKVWVSAENIHTWSRYLGNDPEVSAGSSPYLQGIDAGLLPLTRGYFVGLKLNL